MLRMAPAQQGLHAKHAPITGIVLRLVIEEQFALGQSLAQVMFQTQPLADDAVHFRFEEAIAVAPDSLGGMQCGVGILQQRIDIVAILGIDADADAGAQRNVVAVEQQRAADAGQQALGDHGHHRDVAAIVDQDGELVATLPADRVLLLDRLLQAPRHFEQDTITDPRAEGVVEPLEMVQVEQQQGNQGIPAAPIGHRMRHGRLQGNAVGQGGQRVVAEQEKNPVSRFLTLGDIAREAGHPRHLARLVAQRGQFIFVVAHLAARHGVAAFGVDRLAGGQDLFVPCTEGGSHPGRPDIVDFLADHLGTRFSAEPEIGRIDGDEDTVAVTQPGRIGHAVEELPGLMLGIVEGLRHFRGRGAGQVVIALPEDQQNDEDQHQEDDADPVGPDLLPPGLQRLVATRHDDDVERVVADRRQAEQLVIVCTERGQIDVRLAERR